MARRLFGSVTDRIDGALADFLDSRGELLAASQADLLRHGLGGRGLDDAGVAALREVIVGSGALDQVEQRITERTAEALRALQTDAISEQAHAALENLAVASTDRHT